MNDDDFYNFLRDYSRRDWSWTIDQAKIMDPSLHTQQIYDMLRQLESRKDTDMAYSYSRGYYNDTRGDEVATATLEAYAKGVHFDDLLKKNKKVRDYWYQIEMEKVRAEKLRAQAAERDRKLAEKRALEKAKREEVMTKLTPEELEAFGFVKKGKR